MNIPLSKRLRACAGFVKTGDRVADIGCDHGYLSIYLLKNQIASSVIAADINEMPLQSAQMNAQRFSVRDRIRFYLSDGAEKIPRDFDTMICAGMGADTMISILSGAPWLKSSSYRLILQCQSKTHTLRQFLSQEGWGIHRETVLRDGRFLYTVMEVHWHPESPKLTPGQCYFSPALRQDTAPELSEFFANLLFRLHRAVEGQGEGADPDMVQALQELENDEDLMFLKEDHRDNC